MIKPVSVCLPGYHFPRNQDTLLGCILCPQGTYKNHIGNAGCAPCPEGTTTVTNSAATSIDDCIGKLLKNIKSANVRHCKTSMHYLYLHTLLY